jgi:hypothetical protein
MEGKTSLGGESLIAPARLLDAFEPGDPARRLQGRAAFTDRLARRLGKNVTAEQRKKAGRSSHIGWDESGESSDWTQGALKGEASLS